MNNFFWSWSIPQRSLFLRNSILSISMLSNHRDRSKMFFFHLNDQTSLYRWSCWNTSCQLNSRTFTLDFTCYCFGLLRTTKFPRVTIENKYHVSIVELTIQNLKSEVAKLVRWPRTLIKIFYFSGEQHFFQNSPEIKSRYDRVHNVSIYWPRKGILEPRRQFQQIYWPDKPPGHVSLGHLDRVFGKVLNEYLKSHSSLNCLLLKSLIFLKWKRRLKVPL